MIVGIGVDAVEVARIARALERHPGFAERVFTPAERAASARRGVGATAYLAKRWAAKEAVSKALGVGFSGFRYTDLEVVNHPSGAPSIALGGELAEWARDLGVTSWHLSLSDTRETAVAAVVAEGDPRRPSGPPPWVRRRYERQAGGPGGSRARPEPEQPVATRSRAVAPRSTEGPGGSRARPEPEQPVATRSRAVAPRSTDGPGGSRARPEPQRRAATQSRAVAPRSTEGGA